MLWGTRRGARSSSGSPTGPKGGGEWLEGAPPTAPPATPPPVSQPLKVPKQAGLVVARAQGPRRLYQLNPQGIQDLRAYFDQFWNQALASFKEAVEKETQP